MVVWRGLKNSWQKRSFLCIYWDNHMVFIFQFVNVVYYIDRFVDIEESLLPWDKAHLVMVYDFFLMCCWILIARILLRIFASSFPILLIRFFSLCFLMSLANGLSILFILSKNQLLALFIFAMVSFVSFAFISALI